MSTFRVCIYPDEPDKNIQVLPDRIVIPDEGVIPMRSVVIVNVPRLTAKGMFLVVVGLSSQQKLKFTFRDESEAHKFSALVADLACKN